MSDSRNQEPVDKLIPPTSQNATLPNLVREGVEKFTQEHEQTIFLLSLLTVSSGLLVNVTGRYNNDTMYPNLYLMVVAPPASGKGVMLYARTCIDEIHNQVVKESFDRLQEYRRSLAGNKGGRADELTVEPPRNAVIIPANCTGSKIVQHLQWNEVSNCPSVMIESEIDTLVQANKSEYGNFSDVLRQTFHNESVRLSRRKDAEYIEVREPKLAVALSGTLNQVLRLINNGEDGMYTRFLVCCLDGPTGWSDVTPCERCESHRDYFRDQSERYTEFWEFTKDHPLEVTLTQDQWDTLNRFCEEQHLEAELDDPNSVGIIRRHGVMLFKLCMVLTAFRRFQDGSSEPALPCTAEDFDNAWAIVAESIVHSRQLYKRLHGVVGSKADVKRNNLYDSVPDEFETKVFLGVANRLNIPPRSAQRYLADLVKFGKLQEVSHGKYQKIPNGALAA